MISTAIICIGTRDHLASVRTLLQSARKHAAEASRFALLIDSVGAESVEGLSYAEVLRPEDMLSASDFETLSRKYTASEFCFAMKAPVIRFLLTRGFERVLYLDADTWILGSLDGVLGEMAGAAVLLSPHWRPGTGLGAGYCGEIELLLAGTFNAGCVGVSRHSEAFRFLDWWQQRVFEWGYSDIRNGLCGDQRWLDPVPYLFEGIRVSSLRGFNVGFWNLAGARLQLKGDRYFIDSEEIAIIHWSGFDPNRPDVLSKFNNGVDLSGEPVLRELLARYASRLMENGYIDDRNHPYRYRRWWHGMSAPIRWARSLLVYGKLRAARKAGQ